MSKRKPVKDSSYPFETGDWAKWTNVKRLHWLRNFRDRLTENDGALAKKLGVSQKDVDQVIADTALLEKAVANDQAAKDMVLLGLKRETDARGDDILAGLDASGRKAFFIPPKDILGKKDN